MVHPLIVILRVRQTGATEFPPIEASLIAGHVASASSGGHTPGPNWPTFLTFAERYPKSH
jgi:hypothetical protein